MAASLVRWAHESGQVRTILAQTTDDNVGSRCVLAKLGFIASGPGEEPGYTS